MNIVIWLQEHGLGHKSELLTAIPDVIMNKVSNIIKPGCVSKFL